MRHSMTTAIPLRESSNGIAHAGPKDVSQSSTSSSESTYIQGLVACPMALHPSSVHLRCWSFHDAELQPVIPKLATALPFLIEAGEIRKPELKGAAVEPQRPAGHDTMVGGVILANQSPFEVFPATFGFGVYVKCSARNPSEDVVLLDPARTLRKWGHDTTL